MGFCDYWLKNVKGFMEWHDLLKCSLEGYDDGIRMIPDPAQDQVGNDLIKAKDAREVMDKKTEEEVISKFIVFEDPVEFRFFLDLNAHIDENY